MAKTRSFIGGIILVVGTLLSGHILAADVRPTQDEAKRLTLKAAQILDAKGIEGAKPVFYAEGEFKHGELYVNVIDQKGVWRIYPPKPAAEGRSVLELKDVDDKYLVKEILDVANNKGEGWVEYRWVNPVTNQIQPKITYVKAVPSKGLVAYVGVYK